MLILTLSCINLFILLQNLPENFSDCKLKKKGLVKKVQVSCFVLFLINARHLYQEFVKMRAVWQFVFFNVCLSYIGVSYDFHLKCI